MGETAICWAFSCISCISVVLQVALQPGNCLCETGQTIFSLQTGCCFLFFFSCKHSSFQLHGLKVNFILPPILMPSFACFVVFVLKIGKIFSHVSSGV